MKRIKIIVAVILFCFVFSFSAFADELYDEQHSAVDTEGIYNSLTDEAKEFLGSFDVDFRESDWYNLITYKSVLERIFDLFGGSLKEPLKCMAAAISILFLSAAVKSLSEGKDELKSAVNIIYVLGVCVSVAIPVCSLISAVTSALKGSSVFMLSFVPAFCGVLLISGSVSVSSASSAMLILAAETVSSAVSFIIAPAVSACLALGISSSLTELDGAEKLTETFKKAVIWGLSTGAAVFSAVLSLSTALGSATDKLTLKTAKLFTSSVVPVVGGAISESLSAVVASFSLLKTSVGLMGIIGLAAIFLPIITEILCYKLSVFAIDTVASLLGMSESTGALKALSSALTLMLASVLIVCLLFVVSLSVLIKVGGSI